MSLNRPARLAVTCLTFLALTSCGESVRASQTNYSEVVQVEVEKERKAACAFFEFKDLGPLPPEIIAELARAEAMHNAGEPLLPTQHALIRWMNRDAKKIEMKNTYCASVA